MSRNIKNHLNIMSYYQLKFNINHLFPSDSHLLENQNMRCSKHDFCFVKKTKTRTAIIFKDEIEIIHIKILDGVIVDYEDTLDNLLVVKGLAKGKKALKLIDIRSSFRTEKKARDLINSVDKRQTIARAFYTNSSISKVMLNFIQQLNKPQLPTKVFTSYEEAYNWLLIMKIRHYDKKRDMDDNWQ